MRVKATGDDNNHNNLRGNILILQCDERAKVERELSRNEHQNERSNTE